MRGVPTLPPRKILLPEALKISAMRLTVVVFPLVPVTAIMGVSIYWEASSISLT